MVTKLYEESLKELEFDETYIQLQSLKQNLQKKINQSFPMVQFATLALNHFICYSDTPSIDALAKSFYCTQEEFIILRSLSNEEKVLVNAER